MTDQEELKLKCLEHAEGDLDRAKELFKWVSDAAQPSILIGTTGPFTVTRASATPSSATAKAERTLVDLQLVRDRADLRGMGSYSYWWRDVAINRYYVMVLGAPLAPRLSVGATITAAITPQPASATDPMAERVKVDLGVFGTFAATPCEAPR